MKKELWFFAVISMCTVFMTAKAESEATTADMFDRCSFEESLCGFTRWPGSDNDINWLRTNGSYLFTMGAPSLDHTGSSGFYYASYPSGRIYVITSSVMGPVLETKSRHCMINLYYYATRQFGTLQSFSLGLHTENPWTLGPTVWTIGSSAVKEKWTAIRVDIGHQPVPFQLVFSHTLRGFDKPGMIIIDDITYQNCKQPAPQANCSEETEFRCNYGGCIPKSTVCDGYDNCGDNSDESICADRFIVTFENSSTASAADYQVAPIGAQDGEVNALWSFVEAHDHTLANEHGHYLSMDIRRAPLSPDGVWKAQFTLNPIIAGNQGFDNCSLRFFYRMSGEKVKTLKVLNRDYDGGPLHTMWFVVALNGDWDSATYSLYGITSDFQIVFEGEMSDEGSLHVDDISFSQGCVLSEKTLPYYTTTPTAPTTTPAPCSRDPSSFGCYKSGPDYPCISKTEVCDFVQNCPKGEDEEMPFCVPSQTVFKNYTSLVESGWVSSKDSRFQWTLVDPRNIPIRCKGACPSSDAVAGSGWYAVADSATAENAPEEYATLTQRLPNKMSSSHCHLSFAYFHARSKDDSSFGSLSVFLLTPSSANNTGPLGQSKMLFHQKAALQEWQRAVIPIGRQDTEFFIQFKAERANANSLPSVVAVDYVNFENCEPPLPKPSCKATEFRCATSNICLDSTYPCDFEDDCNEGPSSSDENSELCAFASVARCDFDRFPGTICSLWDHDVLHSSSQKWSVVQASDGYSPYRPEVDHTTRKPTGLVLLMTHRPSRVKQIAHYKSTVRFAVVSNTAICHLRFWLYNFNPSGDAGAVNIMMRISYKPLVERYVANFTDNGVKAWVRQDVSIPAKFGIPFEIVFEGLTGSSKTAGSIAIDDISMLPGCHIVNVLLPGQADAYKTTTLAPACDSTSDLMKCADGNGCYAMSQRCDFFYDCNDGSDESDGCSRSCDFTANSVESWCHWKNSDDAQSKWEWHDKHYALSESGPPGDHTTGTGGYLKATHQATLVSTTFQPGSPACKLQLWYHALYNRFQVPASSLIISQAFQKSGVMTELFRIQASSNLTDWQQANASLYATESFEIQIEVVGGDVSSIIAIDDLQFVDCSPDSPAPETCHNPSDFMCADKSRCISASQLCDFNRDCRDGSDEAEPKCRGERSPGTCTFEGPTWEKVCGLEGNLPDEKLKWQSKSASSILYGPPVDHTFGKADGNVIYVNQLSRDSDLSEKATLVSAMVYPATKTFFGRPSASCNYRFYYFFYRAKGSSGLGKLKIVTIGNTTNTVFLRRQISMVSIRPGGTTKDALFGETWVLETLPITSSEPFRIALVAEVDDSPHSVMAIDDISLSKSCVGEELPPVSVETGCPVHQVACSLGNICVPDSFVCDGECDCPLSRHTPCSDEVPCSSSTTTQVPTTTLLPSSQQTTPLTIITTSTEMKTEETSLTALERNLIIGFSVSYAVVIVLIVGILVYCKCCQSSRKADTFADPSVAKVVPTVKNEQAIPLSQVAANSGEQPAVMMPKEKDVYEF